ncbi:MAG: precorrin-2/cobalt-factor-2 C20-methyltransferase [Clostridiales bacterium]|nr:precorrin-2/cobalt-factor-2 C20-methyltransferase [Clostridiales bacterium]
MREENRKNQGILYGIGVGPGDPELMTLQAMRCLRESQVILLPTTDKALSYAYRTAALACPEIEQKEIICLAFPMTKEPCELERAHEDAYQMIRPLLESKKVVAFLTIGDPCIYATFSYLQKKVVEQTHAACRLINGIPSFCAAAAAAGISLAEQEEQIHIIPASYDVKDSLRLSGTKIYMKAGKKLGSLRELLMQYEEDGLKVYSISEATLPGERVVRGAKNLPMDSGYLTLVIVKGTVV